MIMPAHDKLSRREREIMDALFALGGKASAEEIQAAVGDLRSAMSRPIESPAPGSGAKLRDELKRLSNHYDGAPVEVAWTRRRTVPEDLEQLSQSVLAEALRNAHKHARPSKVEVSLERDEATLFLDICNDGVRGRPRQTGMGLKLAALEALQVGGIVEFGERDPGTWRVRLAVPVDRA